MNNPEVTMHEIGSGNRFEVQEEAIQAAEIAIKLATKVPAPLRSVADHIVRSASSVPANLAEGNGRSGRDRLHHFRVALASAREVDTHIRLLLETGDVNATQTETAVHLFGDVRAMTWRLLHSNPSPVGGSCRPAGRRGRLDRLCFDP
jgi:four helix bundle protein